MCCRTASAVGRERAGEGGRDKIWRMEMKEVKSTEQRRQAGAAGTHLLLLLIATCNGEDFFISGVVRGLCDS